MDIGTIMGIGIGVVGIGVSIFFGVTHVSKKSNKKKTIIKNSFNTKAGKDSNVNVEIDNSFNTHQKNGGEE